MNLPARERLFWYAIAGACVAYLALAAFVLVDDLRCRRLGRGRWSRLDQLLSDAEENAAILRSSESAEPG